MAIKPKTPSSRKPQADRKGRRGVPEIGQKIQRIPSGVSGRTAWATASSWCRAEFESGGQRAEEVARAATVQHGRYQDYDRYDALHLAQLIRRGDISAAEALDEAIARTEAVNRDSTRS